MPDSNDNKADESSRPNPDPAPPHLTEQQAVERYNETLDAGAWDHDAAAAGLDPVTEAYRELLRRKYTRAAEQRKKDNPGT